MQSSTLRTPLESMAAQYTVNEIDAQGNVTLQPQLSAQEEMAQQIGQLWDSYNNFQGLPDISDTSSTNTMDDADDNDDDDMESKAGNGDDSHNATASLPSADHHGGGPSSADAGDMDAYTVRAKVHEQLTLAQSEIQVSLDMVRLLLAAKKRAARGGDGGAAQITAGSSASSSLLAKHDQAPAGSTAFAALVGGDIGAEVTVGGLPFPVGMVDTIKTERRSQAKDSSSEQQTNELKFVLGAKYRQMGEAADTLLLSSQRLQSMARAESGFWRTAFELRRRNWVVQQQRQLMGPSSAARRMMLYGDRYFVRYGYADAGSLFAEDGLAEVLRPSDDCQREEGEGEGDAEDSDVAMTSPSSGVQRGGASTIAASAVAPLFIPSKDRRRMQVRLFTADGQASDEPSGPGFADSSDYCRITGAATLLDRTHARLLGARRALFDRELYQRLCKEARVLELGSIRTTTATTTTNAPASESEATSSPASLLIRDILVTSLGRDNTAVRFEWTLEDDAGSLSSGSGARGDSFVAWQSEYYAGLALVMAAMHQRRLHCEVKQHYLGASLPSRAHVAATGGRAQPPPDAFVAIPVSATAAPPPPSSSSSLSLPTGMAQGQSQPQSTTGAATPLASGAETAGGSGSGSPAAAVPAAVSGADSATAEAAVAAGAGTTFAVARPDLLILAPVLQGMQFAKWQHILSAHTQQACAAWRQLIGEPIEVISHFVRSYRTPDGELSARDARYLRQFCATTTTTTAATTTHDDDGGPAASGECMAYVIRMRFHGGSIMAFRVDSLGNLVFIKGYFPPSPSPPLSCAQTATAGGSSPSTLEDNDGVRGAKRAEEQSQPDQIFIHRAFRIIPLAGLAEFVDQLRREMQSLVLLRVAAALSRCSYQRAGKRCQMGQWYVHQAQLCVVGECWEGAHQRQIIGVPCWDSLDSGVPVVAAGLSDSPADSDTWRLSLAFGPKHPTAFDAPPPPPTLPLSSASGPHIPWTTVYPPPQGSPMAQQISQLKTFEERLFKVLVSSS
ncbi:hypothetical protein GGF42_004650 [Coemansia sp. RSA 2424]|nr:hypothetical protein GGF42_004650 [Coemansia sp. RSA 2424]